MSNEETMHSEEMLFCLCDINKLVKLKREELEPQIFTEDMTEEFKAGYAFGVKLMTQVLASLIEIGEEDNTILVNSTDIHDDYDFEECDLEDLTAKFHSQITLCKNQEEVKGE